MFQLWHKAALMMIAGSMSLPAFAQSTPAKIPQPKVAPKAEVARTERRPASSMTRVASGSDKKASKRLTYMDFLPFGGAQFQRDKTILGASLATAQAGFLLLYFERLNAVRSANADARDVMGGVDPKVARNDPTIIQFLDNNEAYTRKAQQTANLALMGFFAVYAAGVAEAVFDPLAKLDSFTRKKKPATKDNRGEGTAPAAPPSRLVKELREEETEAKLGVFYQPNVGTPATVGLAVQKPL